MSKREIPRVGYCITWNNYTGDGLGALKNWIEEECKYACLQKEIAPETGTPHVQGYLNLKKPQRTKAIQKKLKDIDVSCHIEYAHGTATQNRVYCSKEGGTDFWETGNIKTAGQGSRSDLSIVADKVVKKRPISEIAGEHPESYIRYHRGIKALAFELDEPPNQRPMEVVLLFGDTNTGKSHKARMLASLYGTYYTLSNNGNGSIWFDGYKGELSLVIDEFKGWITPTHLNCLLDQYKLPLQIKGATVYARYEHVFITSNYPPEDWWSDKIIWNKPALIRRITSVYEYRGTNHVDSVVKKLK